MRIRIRLFTLMRIRIRFFFHFDADLDPAPHQNDANLWPLVYRPFTTAPFRPLRLHCEFLVSAAPRSSVLSFHSSWILTLMRIRIRILIWYGSGSRFSLWCGSATQAKPKYCTCFFHINNHHSLWRTTGTEESNLSPETRKTTSTNWGSTQGMHGSSVPPFHCLQQTGGGNDVPKNTPLTLME